MMMFAVRRLAGQRNMRRFELANDALVCRLDERLQFAGAPARK